MEKIYSKIENAFDKLSQVAVKVFGNSLTFILAFLLVLFWMGGTNYDKTNLHEVVRDILLAITFLSFFVLQKAFNRLNAALHIKLNELVSAHENASNRLVNVEEKSEEELKELQERYVKISEEHTQDKKT